VIEEPLTDEERRFLLRLAIVATQEVDAKHRPHVVNIVAKLCGTDTVLVARRAYPAKHYRDEP
jgi:hypothetical protein